MLSLEIDTDVRRLRSDGLTHRQIAARLGISRGSVSNILRGRTRRRRSALSPPPIHGAPKARCNGCGATVSLPCVACATPRKSCGCAADRPDDPAGLALKLHDAHRRTYEALHRRKMTEQPAERAE